jgi:hypothetical protein
MDLPSILETKLSYVAKFWFLFDLANSLIVDLLSNSGDQVCVGLTSLLLLGINSVDVICNDVLFCDAVFWY